MTAAAVADKVPEFWMVIAIKDGTQTPYNFQTHDTAEKFSKNASVASVIDRWLLVAGTLRWFSSCVDRRPPRI